MRREGRVGETMVTSEMEIAIIMTASTRQTEEATGTGTGTGTGKEIAILDFTEKGTVAMPADPVLEMQVANNLLNEQDQNLLPTRPQLDQNRLEMQWMVPLEAPRAKTTRSGPRLRRESSRTDADFLLETCLPARPRLSWKKSSFHTEKFRKYSFNRPGILAS